MRVSVCMLMYRLYVRMRWWARVADSALHTLSSRSSLHVTAQSICYHVRVFTDHRLHTDHRLRHAVHACAWPRGPVRACVGARARACVSIHNSHVRVCGYGRPRIHAELCEPFLSATTFTSSTRRRSYRRLRSTRILRHGTWSVSRR